MESTRSKPTPQAPGECGGNVALTNRAISITWVTENQFYIFSYQYTLARELVGLLCGGSPRFLFVVEKL